MRIPLSSQEELLTKLRLKSKIFKGFSDTSRLCIFEALKDGEKTVTELVAITGFGQSSVSNHLACLRECGLVLVRQEGKNNIYKLRDERVTQILQLVEELLSDVSEEMFNCLKY
ncbi:MAG: ArsR/SmtB family transcription factor [Bacillota bacterium]